MTKTLIPILALSLLLVSCSSYDNNPFVDCFNQTCHVNNTIIRTVNSSWFEDTINETNKSKHLVCDNKTDAGEGNDHY